MPLTPYEQETTDQLSEAYGHIVGTWVRMWPHPPKPGCHLFVGHSKRLPEIRAALEAAGWIVVSPQPGSVPLEGPAKNEIEVTKPPRRRVRARGQPEDVAG